MKCFYTLIFMLLFTSGIKADVIDDLAASLKNANSKEIAQYFTSTVELSIFDKEDIYSNTQAEFILNSFFVKNIPSNSKVLHKVSSNPNYKFGVVLLYTNRGTFRVSYELKSNGGKFNITQIRIEENKN